MIKYLTQDWNRNTKNSKGKFLTFLFRLAALVGGNRISAILLFPYLMFYRFFVEWVLGTEINKKTKIQSGLVIYHGQSLIIHKDTTIGKNCTLRQNTTIGNAAKGGSCPQIGDDVNVGANVCIIGAISIGNNVTIGAGSVVIKSIPSNSVVVGNPGRVIKSLIYKLP